MDEDLPKVPCYVCKKSEQNKIEYGEFLSKGHISVHYFCLLFSNNLAQLCYTELGGIRRFQIKDIKQLVKESSSTKCTDCQENFATVYCWHKGCTEKMHLICASRNLWNLQYADQFKAYCNIHFTVNMSFEFKDNSICRICYEKIDAYNKITTIPSCCNNGWFHLSCLKPYALQAGYYLKCPLCKNSDFRESVRYMGVYVPDSDATWEKNETYKNLHKRHKQCDANVCKCLKGRKYSYNAWPIILCLYCGSVGAHKKCMEQPDDEFICEDCRILNETRSNNIENVMEHTLVSDVEIDNVSELIHTFIDDIITISDSNSEKNFVDLTELSNDSDTEGTQPPVKRIKTHCTERSKYDPKLCIPKLLTFRYTYEEISTEFIPDEHDPKSLRRYRLYLYFRKR